MIQKIAMKKHLILFVFASIMWSCSDKESVAKDIPGWLQVKISEIQKYDKPFDYQVTEYSINQTTYYNISIIYQSCMLCDVYDKEGNKVQISLNPSTEVKLVRTIWPTTKNI